MFGCSVCRRLIQIATLFFATTAVCGADATVQQIESLLNKEHEAGRLNGVVLVADKGRVAYLQAFGDATLDGKASLSPTSAFRLASVAKAFTGMAVAILCDEDKLDLEDNVQKYLPELPYDGIKIRHLLHHTSGLPDYVTLLEQHWDVAHQDAARRRRIARSPDALRMLTDHRPKRHFAAGEKWEYSNTGYILLGLVVERVSGERFGTFLRRKIFTPLDMQNTVLFNPKRPAKIADRAFGFLETQGRREPNDFHFLNGMYGDGEVYSTAEDLLKWDQALYTTKLVSRPVLDQIFTPGVLNDGQPTGYGFGWNVNERNGRRLVAHGGGWVGFRTWIERDVDARRTLIVLTNNTTQSLDRIKAKLQRLVFDSETLMPERRRKVAWESSRIMGRPDPPLPYRAEVAFPNLELRDPVTLTSAPNTSRLFAVQIGGEIVSFPNDPQCESTDAFLDLRAVDPEFTRAYGMAFHPEFPHVPYVYVAYVLRDKDPQGTLVSRFTVNQFDPPKVDVTSQRVLLRWLAGGHNGACVKFGPDGYLYVSAGDGTGPNPPDTLRAGQDLSNLLSTVMRIDVDRADSGRHYAVPEDNPFVDLEGARPEIFAFGFRNPWKFSFDRSNGDLWLGDVGWDVWELVFRVERGGNYGWSITEGSNPIHATDKPGPGPILSPVVEHHHSEARSITGGFVYYGKAHPDLYGCYVYGDYNTGKIWALRYDGHQVTELRELASTPNQIVGWCETNDGELYYADYQRTNRIYQLVKQEATSDNAQFPRRLSETGLFASVMSHQMAPGVMPYRVNAAMWEDGRDADRYLALPGTAQIENDHHGNWTFPENAVAVRTIHREISGVRTRLETQILHRAGGDWRPYSYVWNTAQDDATLAPASGVEVQFGDVKHRVASRIECRICHSSAMGGLLGIHQRQLHTDDGQQLKDWLSLGMLRWPHAVSAARAAHFVDPYDAQQPLDLRARSYLHVNCVSCHRPGGGGPSPIHLDFAQPLEATQLVNEAPVQGDFGLPGASIVVPGDPFRSVLYYRMAKIGAGRMPHLGAQTVDEQGLQLIQNWIRSLPSALPEQLADVEIGTRLASPHGTLQLAAMMRSSRTDSATKALIVERAMEATALHVRDLLEPFFPESMRKQRLGPNFDSDQVLQLSGNPDRGRKIFRNDSLQCVACHRVAGAGGLLGPPLDEVGSRHKSAVAMLETLTRPSAEILPEYRQHAVIKNDGTIILGRVLSRQPGRVELMTADRKQHLIDEGSVEAMTPSDVSLMPEQLLQSLSAQEAADLIAYLRSLVK